MRLLFMGPKRFKSIISVLQRRQRSLTVIADKVHKGRNLAAILRSCDAVGIQQVHNVLSDDTYRSFSGTSASAQKWVTVEHHQNIETPLKRLKAEGFQLVAANLYRDAIDYRDIDFTRPTGIVMGAEVEGVSDFAAEFVDHNIILPMHGMVESYNVSVACALILNEAMRQREAAGFYERGELSKKEYDRLLFEWGYPRMAEILQKTGQPYPVLDENGQLP